MGAAGAGQGALGCVRWLGLGCSPYITHTIRRFGDWVLDLSPPDVVPVTTLDLVPGALFPGDITPAAATAVTAPRRTRARVPAKSVPDGVNM